MQTPQPQHGTDITRAEGTRRIRHGFSRDEGLVRQVPIAQLLARRDIPLQGAALSTHTQYLRILQRPADAADTRLVVVVVVCGRELEQHT